MGAAVGWGKWKAVLHRDRGLVLKGNHSSVLLTASVVGEEIAGHDAV